MLFIAFIASCICYRYVLPFSRYFSMRGVLVDKIKSSIRLETHLMSMHPDSTADGHQLRVDSSHRQYQEKLSFLLDRIDNSEDIEKGKVLLNVMQILAENFVKIDIVLQYWSKFRDSGASVSERSLRNFLSQCFRQGNRSNFPHVVDLVRSIEIEHWSRVSLNIFCKICFAAGRPLAAIELVDKFAGLVQLKRDSLEAISNARDLKIVDYTTLLILVSGLGHAGLPSLANEIKLMNVYLSMLLRVNNVTDAQTLFSTMAKKGHIDLYSVNIMLTHYVNRHDIKGGKQVWAQRDSFQIDHQIYSTKDSAENKDGVATAKSDKDGEDIAHSLMVRCLCSIEATMEDLSEALSIARKYPHSPVMSALLIGFGAHCISPTSTVDVIYELLTLRWERMKSTDVHNAKINAANDYVEKSELDTIKLKEQFGWRIYDLETTLEVALSSLLAGYASIHRNDLCIAAYMRAYDVFDPLIAKLNSEIEVVQPAAEISLDRFFRSHTGPSLPHWPLTTPQIRRLDIVGGTRSFNIMLSAVKDQHIFTNGNGADDGRATSRPINKGASAGFPPGAWAMDSAAGKQEAGCSFATAEELRRASEPASLPALPRPAATVEMLAVSSERVRAFMNSSCLSLFVRDVVFRRIHEEGLRMTTASANRRTNVNVEFKGRTFPSSSSLQAVFPNSSQRRSLPHSLNRPHQQPPASVRAKRKGKGSSSEGKGRRRPASESNREQLFDAISISTALDVACAANDFALAQVLWACRTRIVHGRLTASDHQRIFHAYLRNFRDRSHLQVLNQLIEEQFASRIPKTNNSFRSSKVTDEIHDSTGGGETVRWGQPAGRAVINKRGESSDLGESRGFDRKLPLPMNAMDVRTRDEIVNALLRCGGFGVALEKVLAMMHIPYGHPNGSTLSSPYVMSLSPSLTVITSLLIWFDRHWRDYDSQTSYPCGDEGQLSRSQQQQQQQQQRGKWTRIVLAQGSRNELDRESSGSSSIGSNYNATQGSTEGRARDHYQDYMGVAPTRCLEYDARAICAVLEAATRYCADIDPIFSNSSSQQRSAIDSGLEVSMSKHFGNRATPGIDTPLSLAWASLAAALISRGDWKNAKYVLTRFEECCRQRTYFSARGDLTPCESIQPRSIQSSRIASEVARVVSLAIYSSLDGSLPLLTQSATEATQFLLPRLTRLGASSMLRMLPAGFRLESGPKRTVCSMLDIVEFLETCSYSPVASSGSSSSDLAHSLSLSSKATDPAVLLTKCPVPVSLLQALFVDAISHSKYSPAARLIRVLQSTRLVLDCEIRVPLPSTEAAADAQELVSIGERVGAPAAVPVAGSAPPADPTLLKGLLAAEVEEGKEGLTVKHGAVRQMKASTTNSTYFADPTADVQTVRVTLARAWAAQLVGASVNRLRKKVTGKVKQVATSYCTKN